MLITDSKCFELHECVECITIVTGRDPGKDVLALLLTMSIEMMDGTKRYMDEVIGEIDDDKDNI